MKFYFQNVGNGKKNKNGGRLTTFDLKNAKMFSKTCEKFFFIIKIKSTLSTSFFISSIISQILRKKKVIYYLLLF